MLSKYCFELQQTKFNIMLTFEREKEILSLGRIKIILLFFSGFILLLTYRRRNAYLAKEYHVFFDFLGDFFHISIRIFQFRRLAVQSSAPPFYSVKYALSQVCHSFHWIFERLLSVFTNSDDHIMYNDGEIASVSARILSV